MSHDHAFAIPVYGEPPHLTACIESILKQSPAPGSIVMSTSTPSRFLEDIAARYGLPMRVNPHRDHIAADWNFALASCREIGRAHV